MDTRDTKISVIIPVYNTSEYLHECLDSVIGQSFDDFEIIIVNDCSTDSSPEIINQYAKKDARIVSIEHEKNLGLPSTRNTGLQAATGKYVLHLDSDDYWLEPLTLQLLYDTAENDQCEVLRFNGLRVGGVENEEIFKKFEGVNLHFDDTPEYWELRSVFTFLFRRDFIESQGVIFNPDLSIGEDSIYLSQILPKSQRISSIANELYAYRVAASSMMRNNWNLDKFLEEHQSAQLSLSNIEYHSEAWLNLWQWRLNRYLPERILPRAIEVLPPDDLVTYLTELKSILKADTLKVLYEHHSTSKLAKNILTEFEKGDLKGLVKVVKTRGGFFQQIKNFIKRSKLISGILIKLYLYARWKLGLLKREISQKLKGTLHKPLNSLLNIEGNEPYNIQLTENNKKEGVSAMLRVKNEEEIITDCLKSIYDIFDEIVIVDNNSSDHTAVRINEFKSTMDHQDKIRLHEYPFVIARCGVEHQNTPENSLHNLAYYYNWCLSKCSCKSVFKWDADMQITSRPDARKSLKRYIESFSKGPQRHGGINVQTVYIDQNGKKFLAKSEINNEVRIFRNTPKNYFKKGKDWEVLVLGDRARRDLKEVLVYEIKNVRKDEFENWTNQSFSTERKVREFRNFRYVQRRKHLINRQLFEPTENL